MTLTRKAVIVALIALLAATMLVMIAPAPSAEAHAPASPKCTWNYYQAYTSGKIHRWVFAGKAAYSPWAAYKVYHWTGSKWQYQGTAYTYCPRMVA